jgi:ATP-dependent helicase/nuclease subunit A
MAAARRGVMMHRLLERLPEAAGKRREEVASTWLARNAPELSEAERAALVESALGVIENPRWAELFGPRSLAEVPIAAVVGDRVVAGTIDRLLLGETIRIVDFKTARRPPEDARSIPLSTLRQMAAYVAALERAYPGRSVEAAVLYTAIPRLIAIPEDLLAEHKMALLVAQ